MSDTQALRFVLIQQVTERATKHGSPSGRYARNVTRAALVAVRSLTDSLDSLVRDQTISFVEVCAISRTKSGVTLFQPCFCHRLPFDFEPCIPSGMLADLQSKAFRTLRSIECHGRPLSLRVLRHGAVRCAGDNVSDETFDVTHLVDRSAVLGVSFDGKV